MPEQARAEEVMAEIGLASAQTWDIGNGCTGIWVTHLPHPDLGDVENADHPVDLGLATVREPNRVKSWHTEYAPSFAGDDVSGRLSANLDALVAQTPPFDIAESTESEPMPTFPRLFPTELERLPPREWLIKDVFAMATSA